ncbi:hypothetical protein FFB58_10480 [Enterobacter sp. MF024]|uniref:hypothetical protein n=1 Tax=Enterobacter sp. MF024 TaxID=2555644 RepID=UPI001106895E|nr:hypothetical protein [Enterobacter sp. MF024]TLU68307.1 hypothetical protein FFB58_10480 [Enterobacter sp. MF024]
MSRFQLIDAQCRVEQAQAVLSVWLECGVADDRDQAMIGSLISLLEGVPEAMISVENEMVVHEMQVHREKNKCA